MKLAALFALKLKNIPRFLFSSTRHNYDFILDNRVLYYFFIFRLVSLVLTSALYLWTLSIQGFTPRLIVVALTLASLAFFYVYKNYRQHIIVIYLLVLVEASALMYLLTFTGGIESPFIWYTLNPVIMASAHLPFLFTWLFLVGVFVF